MQAVGYFMTPRIYRKITGIPLRKKIAKVLQSLGLRFQEGVGCRALAFLGLEIMV